MKTVLKTETKVVVGGARLSYANIFEPKSINGSDPKYSVSLIIDKKDNHTLEIIKKAIDNAIKEGSDKKWGGKMPKNLKTPLRDGDEERDDAAYTGAMFLNANSTKPPAIVGKERDRSTNKAIPLGADDVYSGCYANVSVNFYAFDVNGNRGVAVGLGNIQKERDGEPLGGHISHVEDDFDFVDVDAEDDFLS